MPRPQVRLRKETFGVTLAFSTGEIGFYDDSVAPELLQGTNREQIEKHRLRTIPITENFHLSAPFIVWFEITRSCNLPCKHCYVSAGQRRRGELSTDEIFTILEQLRAKGVFALVLVGGEPMMHPDFLQILNYAHDLGFIISIATNGTLINQEIIDGLPREECIVSVSLDGMDFHKEMRVKSTYQEIRHILLLLKRNDIRTAIMTTLTDRNVHELEAIFEFAQENGFFFGTAPFSPVGRGRFFPYYLPTEDVVERASQLYVRDCLWEDEMLQHTGLCVTRFLQECYRLSHAMRREFCGISLAYILSDGSTFPCSICASTGKFPAGNLRERTFDDIWEHSFQEVRRVTFDDFKECPSCPLSAPEYFCTSRCPVMSEIYTGDPFRCGSTPYLKASLKRKTELLNVEHF